MKEKGIVLKLEGKNTALVRFIAGSACKKCNACLMGNKGEAMILAENSVGAKIGDAVEVNINPSDVIWSSFLAFIIPLFSMGIGYFIGSIISKEGAGENYSIIGAMLFLGLSFLGLGLYDKNLKKNKKHSKAIIMEIIT